MTLCGSGVSADVITCGHPGVWYPWSNEWCLHKKTEMWIQASLRGDGHVVTEEKIWTLLPRSQGIPRIVSNPQKLEEARDFGGRFPRDFGGSVAMLTSLFKTYSFQNSVNKFLFFYPPSLWYFARTALRELVQLCSLNSEYNMMIYNKVLED